MIPKNPRDLLSINYKGPHGAQVPVGAGTQHIPQQVLHRETLHYIYFYMFRVFQKFQFIRGHRENEFALFKNAEAI